MPTIYNFTTLEFRTASVIFEFCRQKGPLLTSSRYFGVAVIFGQVKNMVSDKEGTYYEVYKSFHVWGTNSKQNRLP